MLAFAAFALPGHAGLHWALGVEHQHSSKSSVGVGKSEHSIKHARCKHHHHAEQSQGPISVPESHDDYCRLCDFFAQPLICTVAAPELSVATERVAPPLADEVVGDIAELGTPPARGPPGCC